MSKLSLIFDCLSFWRVRLWLAGSGTRPRNAAARIADDETSFRLGSNGKARMKRHTVSAAGSARIAAAQKSALGETDESESKKNRFQGGAVDSKYKRALGLELLAIRRFQRFLT